MKSFSRLSLLVAAVAAIASAATYVRDVGAYCIGALSRGARWLFDLASPAPESVAATADEPQPKVQLVRAVAYRLGRLMRRERVDV